MSRLGSLRFSVDDKMSLKLLRNQVETAESGRLLGVYSDEEYERIMKNVSDQLDKLEEKYGLKDYPQRAAAPSSQS